MYFAARLEKRSLGTAAQGEFTAVTMPTGLIAGVETVLFFTLFLLFPAAHVWLFCLMGLLMFATMAKRFDWTVRHV